MSYISAEEYLKLIEDAEASEYEDDEFEADSFTPIENFEKPAKTVDLSNIMIDLTDYKSDKIQEVLYTNIYFKVGEFIFKIDRYAASPKGNFQIRISILEKKYRTLNGNPCNMDVPIDHIRDDRFLNKPWSHYFVQTTSSYKYMPIETGVEIIRWLQILTKLSAFI